jgi:hypothetical protein
MTGPLEPATSVRDGHGTILAASRAARRAAIDLARSEGTQLTARPAFPGSQIVTTDLRPLEGARALRRIEIGARQEALEYIRQAREDGASWDQIGRTLGLSPGTGESGTTVAEAAYTYAAGSPDTDLARRYDRSFGWVCGTCQRFIDDRGVQTGPADDEHGHTETCQRLAQTITAWETQWEAGNDMTSSPIARNTTETWRNRELRARIARIRIALPREAANGRDQADREPEIDREAEP